VEDAALVRVVHRLGDRDHQPRGGLGVGGERGKRTLKGCTGDELHREVASGVVLADLVDRDDVRVVEQGDGLGLVAEPADLVFGGQCGGADHLERNLAVQADLARLVDDAHAAAANLGLDLVVAEVADERAGSRVAVAAGLAAGRGRRPIGSRTLRLGSVGPGAEDGPDQLGVLGKAERIFVGPRVFALAATQFALDAQQLLEQRGSQPRLGLGEIVLDLRPRTYLPGAFELVGGVVDPRPVGGGDLSHGLPRLFKPGRTVPYHISQDWVGLANLDARTNPFSRFHQRADPRPDSRHRFFGIGRDGVMPAASPLGWVSRASIISRTHRPHNPQTYPA
jgi:hypothetical protein